VSPQCREAEHNLNKKVEVSAPGKLMLFGEHAVIYQRPCIVTAVDQRMRVSAELTDTKFFKIDAPDVGVAEYSEEFGLPGTSDVPKGVRFTAAATRNFYQLHRIKSGVTIRTKSDFSNEFGFGSSSAVTTAVLKALSDLFEIGISKEELFELSYKTVLDVQGVGSGFDLAAAIWGGTLYFRPRGPEIVPLRVKDLPLTVGFTGIKADTPTLVRQVADLHARHEKLVDRIFDTVSGIVEEAREALEDMELPRLGELMDLNQGLLDSLGVSSFELARLMFAARQAGAKGAKLSGAGGGDCMIALSSEQNRERVEESIQNSGGKVLRVRTDAPGVRSE
jgi:mevalonate kinase